MRKLSTLLCLTLLANLYAMAQKNMYVISKSGDLQVYQTQDLTFSNDLFSFTYGDVTELTSEKISGSVNVAFKSEEHTSLAQEIEVGICFSAYDPEPTVDNSKVKAGTTLGESQFSIYNLNGGTKYYYRAYAKVNGAVTYGDVEEVTTQGEKPTYTVIDGHYFVDLGIPGGLLWATCNIGAETPADNGTYFAWGETSIKSDYSKDSYTCSKYSEVASETLDNSDDAVYTNWGSSCRMPTVEDLLDLEYTDYCTWNWTTKTDCSGATVYGYEVVSKKNGNSIFLPVTGYKENKDLNDTETAGYYWSKTKLKYDTDPTVAKAMYFDNSGITNKPCSRYIGYQIRPVAEPK